MNVIAISGNLVRDPEVIDLNSGTQKGVFRIVNSRRYKTKDGEKKEDSVGFDVECWGGIINVLQYLKKGSGVMLSGRIRENKWKDKDTEENRSKMVLVAENIDFLDKKTKTDDAPAPNGAPDDNSGEDNSESDIPF